MSDPSPRSFRPRSHWRSRTVLLVAFVALAVGAFAEHARLRWRAAPPTADFSHLAIGRIMAVAQAEVGPRGQAVVIGDSIAEMAWLDRLCGMQVANLAIGGSRVADWLGTAPKIDAALHPALVVIALGTNDASAGDTSAADRWRSDYKALIRDFPGSRIILVPPPTVGSGSPYSVPRLREQRAFVAGLAGGNVRVAPLTRAPTFDGVHPTPAGRRLWMRNLASACLP